jgi:signal peptidase I
VGAPADEQPADLNVASLDRGSAPDAPAEDSAGASPSGADARPRRRPSLVAVGIALIALIVVVKIFVAEPFRIPSQSMEPTLRPGDQALVDKLAGKPPHRGELVAFHAPRTGEILLKRVVAVGGDTVGLEDGVLVVDGRAVHEPYADPKAIDSVYFGPVKVRPGTVFVMGDNRANSEDSRDFGAVPADRIIGRAVARVWPPARWGATP